MNDMFFKIALLAYLLSTVGYVSSLLVKRVMVAKFSTWILFSAVTSHAIYIGLRWIETGYRPVVNLHESFSFIAFAVSGIYLAFQIKTKTRVLGAFVSPLAFSLMMVASIRLAGDVSMPAALKGPWVLAHIILSLTGESLLALACCAGVMYLIQDNLIKKKKIYSFTRFLPSLRDLDRINYACILFGFIFLTLGAIAGSIWARTVWGSHWQWDPKQICILISWFLYAMLLHQRLAIGWTGRKAALFSILAFSFLLFAFAGVNIFFVSVHTFV